MPDSTDALLDWARNEGGPAARLALEYDELAAALDRLGSGEELRALELRYVNALRCLEESKAREDAQRRRALAAEEQARYWRNVATRGAVDTLLADDVEDAAYFAGTP